MSLYVNIYMQLENYCHEILARNYLWCSVWFFCRIFLKLFFFSFNLPRVFLTPGGGSKLAHELWTLPETRPAVQSILSPQGRSAHCVAYIDQASSSACDKHIRGTKVQGGAEVYSVTWRCSYEVCETELLPSRHLSQVLYILREHCQWYYKSIQKSFSWVYNKHFSS